MAVCEASFGNELGVELAIDTDLRADFLLFSESQSRILLSVPEDQVEAIEMLASEKNVACRAIGTVGGEDIKFTINGVTYIDAPLQELKAAWKDAIACRMK